MIEKTSAVFSPGLLSIVVPVYGCVDCLETLCQRVNQTMAGTGRDYELILVDDRSPDQAWTVIRDLQGRFGSVKGVRLSRNFGQHIAITAGLAQACGDYGIVMDCDLQDPPEIIPKLISKIDEGYDLVLARRVERHHSLFRLLGAKIYFRLLQFVTGVSVDGTYGTFSMLSRKVIDKFLSFDEKERHYLFIIRWLGFRVGTIEYEHQKRFAGPSSYSFRTLFRHAVDGLFFQATVLLRWIIGLGLLYACAGLVLAGIFVFSYFVQGSLPGWTSLIVVVLLSTAAVLISLGVIGQYIGKIFEQTKGRPLYVIDTISERTSK
jgi:polyisoprenyl-phosphate glycosyltransferase